MLLTLDINIKTQEARKMTSLQKDQKYCYLYIYVRMYSTFYCNIKVRVVYTSLYYYYE